MSVLAGPVDAASPDIATVVSAGVCVGCGACAVAAPTEVAVRLTTSGTYLPITTDGKDLAELEPSIAAKVSEVCPFSNHSRDEDAIGESLFAGDDVAHHEVTGYYRKIVAGHVAGGDFRERGTSGGMTTWMLHRLLESGEVDGVVHVSSTLSGLPGALSRYTISRTSDDLLGGRKSRYHVQTLVDVMQQVRDEPGRYAVVGVPCFVKAVRLLAESDDQLRERIVFTASLVCGHYKSALYSEYLAWSVNVKANEVRDIDYRHKVEGRPPNRYCVRVSTTVGEDEVRGVERIPMADWGIGLFKLGACDYCDDIVGETADVSFGDAWLPPFMSDWQGANLAIARSPLAERILTDGEDSGELTVIAWSADDVAESQAGAVRHRRPGLAVRLADRHRRGVWAPTKRVEPLPESELDSAFAQRMLNRQAIAVGSAPAFLAARERNDLQSFIDAMRPLIRRYDGRRATTTWRRAAAAIVARLPPKAEAGIRRVLRAVRFR